MDVEIRMVWEKEQITNLIDTKQMHSMYLIAVSASSYCMIEKKNSWTLSPLKTMVHT